MGEGRARRSGVGRAREARGTRERGTSDGESVGGLDYKTKDA